MKNPTNIALTLFLAILTLTSALIFAFSFSKTNDKLNGFPNDLDEKGFWLNPGNVNVSVLKEEDHYIGSIVYPQQNDQSKLVLGINQASGYAQININRKFQTGSISIVRISDPTTGELDSTPATPEEFYTSLANSLQNNTSQKMDLCVSKAIGSTDYDYFCGITIYEN
ncbi:MAG: hypothetical protein ABIM99_02110 [Candidatus Dojkabacteria bacterium]